LGQKEQTNSPHNAAGDRSSCFMQRTELTCKAVSARAAATDRNRPRRRWGSPAVT
jgi:hypothetical protein